MEKESAKIIPFKAPTDGVWLRPHVACNYFNSGRGISERTLMNKIYAGELRGLTKHDITGWFVFVSNTAIEASKNASMRFVTPLKAA